MKKQQYKSAVPQRIFGMILVIAGMVIGVNNAYATEPGLIVSPSIVEVSITNGEVRQGSILVKNTAKKAVSFTVKSGTFDVDDNGVTSLTLDNSPYFQIDFEESTLIIDPESIRKVNYTVKNTGEVPARTHPLAIVIQSVCDEALVTVGLCIRARVGIPLIVTVDGQGLTYESVVEFEGMKYLSFGSGTEVVARVHNVGSAAFRPHGTVTIKSLFGAEVVRAEITPQHIILPERSRKFTFILQHPHLFGIYKVTAQILENDRVIYKKSHWSIIISSTKVIIFFSIGVMVITAWVMWHRRFVRKR